MLKKILVLIFLLFFAYISVGYCDDIIGRINDIGSNPSERTTVYVFQDPDVPGVSCYLSIPENGISVSPTNMAIRFVKTGPITQRPSNRSRVFTIAQLPIFRLLKIDRIYDSQRNAIVYLCGMPNILQELFVLPL